MAQEQLEELLNALIPFAQQMLNEEGEFYAFAGMTDSEGETSLVGLEYDEDFPDDADLLELFTEALQEKAKLGEILASGICLNVRVTHPESNEPIDAICVLLESQAGESIDAFLPYEIVDEDDVTYGELFVGSGTSKVFASDPV